MKDNILEVLKTNSGYISGEKISDQFGISRTAIWKHMNSLKNKGYEIESIPRKGYKLINTPDILTYMEIKEHLDTNFIGKNIKYFNTIGSTNAEAKKIAGNVGEGYVIVSEEQTLGRGRMGRDWISPKGKGIWMSIILKPSIAPIEVGKITLIGAAAVAKSLNDIGINSNIKWPNDILLNNKKICGILTEMNCEMDMVNHIIMGIGINVNLNSADIPNIIKNKASSIKIETGKKINRKKLLASILNNLEIFYEELCETKNINTTIKINKKYSNLLGKHIRVINNNKTQKAYVKDINKKGELVVKYQDGSIENIFSGEVSIRGLNGYVDN